MRPSSVSFGHDSEIVDALLSVHGNPKPVIVDLTHNTGKMWVGARHQPALRIDLDPAMPVDVAGDFRALPLRDGSVDVLVFDPPHILDSASSKYGMYGVSERGQRSIAHNFPAVVSEAVRVLRPQGIVLAKLADMVHDHRYQWAQVQFVTAVQAAGLTACDMVVKVSNVETMIDPKWKAVHHTRRSHSYWIVARKGRCERKAA